MNANATTPSCAIENGTPVDLAITPVAAAVPGPQTTSAAVPTNSAAILRTTGTSAMASPHAWLTRTCGRHLPLTSVETGRDAVRIYRTSFREPSVRPRSCQYSGRLDWLFCLLVSCLSACGSPAP